MVDLEAVDDLVDVRAVLDAVIQLKHQLRRVAQIQHASQLPAQPAGGRLDAAAKFLFVLQAHHGKPDLAVAQVAGGLHTRDADHALLHAGVLDVPQLCRDDALDIVIDSCDFIG